MIFSIVNNGEREYCLNPCCNGIYLMMCVLYRICYGLCSLNPCCNGIYLMITKILTLGSFSCLNPCCNGIYLMM